MARWILFRDVGAGRAPCEVARCEAVDWQSAAERLARYANGRDCISLAPHAAPTTARPFYVQSVVSVSCDAHAHRLRARPFVAPPRLPPRSAPT